MAAPKHTSSSDLELSETNKTATKKNTLDKKMFDALKELERQRLEREKAINLWTLEDRQKEEELDHQEELRKRELAKQSAELALYYQQEVERSQKRTQEADQAHYQQMAREAAANTDRMITLKEYMLAYGAYVAEVTARLDKPILLPDGIVVTLDPEDKTAILSCLTDPLPLDLFSTIPATAGATPIITSAPATGGATSSSATTGMASSITTGTSSIPATIITTPLTTTAGTFLPEPAHTESRTLLEAKYEECNIRRTIAYVVTADRIRTHAVRSGAEDNQATVRNAAAAASNIFRLTMALEQPHPFEVLLQGVRALQSLEGIQTMEANLARGRLLRETLGRVRDNNAAIGELSPGSLSLFNRCLEDFIRPRRVSVTQVGMYSSPSSSPEALAENSHSSSYNPFSRVS